MWKSKGAETILKKKDKVGEITTRFEFLLYIKVIKALWYRHRERDTDQWNRMGSPDAEPYEHSRPTPDQVQKRLTEEEGSFHRACWSHWVPHPGKCILTWTPHLLQASVPARSHSLLNGKLKLSEENIESLWGLGFGEEFSDVTPKAWSIRKKINLNSSNFKTFLCKRASSGNENEAIDCNKIFASHLFEEALISRIHTLKTLQLKKIIIKGQKT